MDLDSLMLSVNAAITLACGVYIFSLISRRKVERHLFYLLFGLGFVVYGVQLILRVLFNSFQLSAFMLGASFTIISLGLGSLDPDKRLLFYIILFYVIGALLLVSIIFLNVYPFERAIPISGLVYIPFILLLLYHRVALGAAVDKLVIGGFFLLLTNTVLIAFGWIADLFAIVSKFIILLGILNYDFIILAQKIRKGDQLRLPVDTDYRHGGGIKIIEQSVHSSISNKFNWMMKKIKECIEADKIVYVFSFQGDVSYEELWRLKWLNPERVFILLFSSGTEKLIKEFEVFSMDLTKLGATLSEIIKGSWNRGRSSNGSVIIFTNLSILLHLYDVYKVYSLLLSKLSAFRETGVELYMFLYPETHEKQSETASFLNIADEIVKI